MGCIENSSPVVCFRYEQGKLFAMGCQDPTRKEEFGTPAYFENRLDSYQRANERTLQTIGELAETLRAAHAELDKVVQKKRTEAAHAQTLMQTAATHLVASLQRFRRNIILDRRYLSTPLTFCQKYLWCDEPLLNSLEESINRELVEIQRDGYVISLGACEDFEFGPMTVTLGARQYLCDDLFMDEFDDLQIQNSLGMWREIAERGIPFTLYYDPTKRMANVLVERRGEDRDWAYWRASQEIMSRQYREQNPSRSNLSPETLTRSAVSDEHIYVIWVDFVSSKGNKYSVGHVFEHPKGPYLALAGDRREDRAEFLAVERQLAQIYGAKLKRDFIDDRGERGLFSANIEVRAFSQIDIARKVVGPLSRAFRNVEISTVHYQRVTPELAQLLPSENK